MAILQTTGVTGSLEISSSRIPLSTSASLFNVNGYNGRLFDVVDNLSGSLFSVNTIAGLPVLDIWSDNRVFAGKYNANDFVISGSRIGMGTAFPLATLHVSGSSATSIIDGVRIGRGAGNIITNTVVGNNALISNTTGIRNSAFGFRALNANTISSSNSAFGYLALTTNTGGNNSAFGSFALANNTSGIRNNAFGFQALRSNTTGFGNCSFGNYTLLNNRSGIGNSAFGNYALLENLTGNRNVAVGINALRNNTTNNNSAFGHFALASNTTGIRNSAFGYKALNANTINSSNSAFGYLALATNITANNSAFGSFALASNTTGFRNNAFGYRSLQNNTSGRRNNAFGTDTLQLNVLGSNNNAFGYDALQASVSSNNNNAFGFRALSSNNTNNNNAFGYQALANNTTGIRNSAFGHRALNANTISGSNSAFGYLALATNTGDANSAFGSFALASNTSGVRNSAFGHAALASNTIGGNNNAFGSYALSKNTTGNVNCAFGRLALASNTSGQNNNAFGAAALLENLTGNNNVAVGVNALRNNTTNNNSAFGHLALASNTTGARNSAFGYRALQGNTISSSNSAFGYLALTTNTGRNNNAFGYRALASNTSGFNNNAFGTLALASNTIGLRNSAFGEQALRANTISSSNSAFGYRALATNTGRNNSAFGDGALRSNVSGFNNNAFGHASLANNTIGSRNNAFGVESLRTNVGGNNNNAFGYLALASNTSGNNNIAFGNNALRTLTLGSRNIAIGSEAGDVISTGNNNIIIGHNIDAPVDAGSNQLNIANLIFASGSAFGQGKQVSTGSFVGIGTSTPNTNLNIRSTNNAGAAAIRIQNASVNSNASSSIVFTTTTNNVYNSAEIKQTRAGGNNLSFLTDNATRLYISASGNVGIGTTVPTGKLHLRDDTTGPTLILEDKAANNDPYIRFVPSPSNVSFAVGIDDSDGDKFKISYGANNTSVLGTNDRFVIDTSGNVGINTESPQKQLQVRSTNASTSSNSAVAFITNYQTTFVSGSYYGGIGIATPGSNGGTLGAGMLGVMVTNSFRTELAFVTKGGDGATDSDISEKVRITQTGRVGIGTTSPAYKAEIIGNLRVSNGIFDAGSSAQWTLSGGNTVTWNGSSILWSSRVIAIPVERDEFGSAGFIDINCPTSGTITYYNSSNTITTVTCTVNGIPLGVWEALYYEVTPGQPQTSDITKFRVVAYQNSTWRPSSNWLLIAVRNGDASGHLKWIPGQVNFPNSGGVYFSQTGLNNWQLNGTVNNVSKFTATNVLGNSQIFDDGTNVGIGTTSPQERLHISSSAMAGLRLQGLTDSTVQFVGPNTHSYSAGIDVSDSDKFKISYAASKTPPILGGGGVSDRFVIQTNGRVGIDNGSVAIDGKFQVFHNGGDGSGGNTQIGILNVAASGQSTIGCQTINGDLQSNLLLGSTISGTNRFWLVSKRASTAGEAHALRFYYYNGSTFSTPIVSMETNGNVGINVTNPLYKLDVGGTARISNDVGIGGIPDSGARLYVQGENLTEPFLSVQTCLGNNSISTTTFSSLKGYLAVKIGNNVGVSGALITADTYYIRLWGTP